MAVGGPVAAAGRRILSECMQINHTNDLISTPSRPSKLPWPAGPAYPIDPEAGLESSGPVLETHEHLSRGNLPPTHESGRSGISTRNLQRPSSKSPPSKKTHPSFSLLHTHAYLIVFSILGTLARLGLTSLTTYSGSPLSGVIWANFCGSLVMGLLAEDTQFFTIEAGPVKSVLPLYVGLSTGFCGSLTSFSSLILAAFLSAVNVAPTYDRKNAGYDIMALLAYIIATLALSMGGLQSGAHLSRGLRAVTPSIPYRAHIVLNWATVPLAIGIWGGAAAVAGTVEKTRGEAALACVLAPLGVGVRFWVSKLANPWVQNFPIGTFMVNIAGTAVLAAVTVGRGVGTLEMLGCQFLRGIGDGFCGCLTTVSTWVVEMRGLGLKHAYLYGTASVVAGFAIVVMITGSWVVFPQ